MTENAPILAKIDGFSHAKIVHDLTNMQRKDDESLRKEMTAKYDSRTEEDKELYEWKLTRKKGERRLTKSYIKKKADKITEGVEYEKTKTQRGIRGQKRQRLSL